MKLLKFHYILFLTLLISCKFYSQVACGSAAPFCASSVGANGVTFPAGVNNGTAAPGTDYGCLFSQPNPAWYYFQVSTSGSIVMSIAGSGGFDVDFVCWGPFTSQTACGALSNSCSPNCPTNVGSPGFYPSGNMADCSYSGNSAETCTINNALVGEFYMMLITNFSNQPQNINFNQSGGTGATDCSILPSSSSHTICPAQTATLVASTTLLNPTFTWTPGGATTQTVYVSPAVTTSYSVTVAGSITAGGTQTTVVNTSTVVVSPSPTVTLGSNAPVCAGATLSLTATGGLTYNWQGPGGFLSSAQNPVITNVPASAAGIYTAIVTNAAGCSNTGTINIALGSPSSPTLTSNSPVCAGGTLSLTATGAATSYTWTGPGAFTSNVQNPVITSVTSSGVYSLASSGSLCISLNTISITVVPITTVTLNSNSPICQGTALALSATGSATTFTWTGPGGFTSNLQNPTIPSVSSSGDYTLTTGTLNCPTVNTISTVVIPYTIVTIGSNSPICSGNTLSLTATATAPTYTWTGPGGFTSNLQNPTITPILTSGVYTLTTGTSGCNTVNTISITVIPAIPININALPTICNNANINLTAPAGGNIYNWVGPNGFTSNSQNPVINNASVVNQGIYSVSVTVAGCLNTGFVNVSVYNILSYVTIPKDTTLCSGNTVNISASGTGGSGTYNYSWNPSTDLSNSNNATTVATGNTTTQYTVTLSDANCALTQTVQAVVTISVNPTPTITLGNLRGCEPYAAPLQSSSNPPSASCSWLFSNNIAYGQCNSTGFVFPVHGIYDATLSVIDVNGCPATLTQTAYVIVDPKPLPDFSNLPTNPTVLINEVSFSDNSSVGLPIKNRHWIFGDYFLSEQNDTSNIQNPSHVYENAATYTVTLVVTNNFGCKDEVTKLVIVEQEFALFIPNAFTPSKAEGRNDVFIPQGIGFLADSFEMLIYDRWGTLIYKTTDITKGWDGSIKGSGKLAEQGVYVYKIFVKDFKNRDKEFVGHLTLL